MTNWREELGEREEMEQEKGIIRKVGPQVILVNNLYVASEVGLYSFDYINLSNFN